MCQQANRHDKFIFFQHTCSLRRWLNCDFEMVFFHCGDDNVHAFVTNNTLYCILQHFWITLSMFLRKPSQRVWALELLKLSTANRVKCKAVFVSTSIDAANRCTTNRHPAWQVRESTTTTWWSPWLHCCTTMTRPNYDFSWLFHIDPIHTAVNIDSCNYIWIMYNLYCRTKSFNHW